MSNGERDLCFRDLCLCDCPVSSSDEFLRGSSFFSIEFKTKNN